MYLESLPFNKLCALQVSHWSSVSQKQLKYPFTIVKYLAYWLFRSMDFLSLCSRNGETCFWERIRCYLTTQRWLLRREEEHFAARDCVKRATHYSVCPRQQSHTQITMQSRSRETTSTGGFDTSSYCLTNFYYILCTGDLMFTSELHCCERSKPADRGWCARIARRYQRSTNVKWGWVLFVTSLR